MLTGVAYNAATTSGSKRSGTELLTKRVEEAEKSKVVEVNGEMVRRAAGTDTNPLPLNNPAKVIKRLPPKKVQPKAVTKPSKLKPPVKTASAPKSETQLKANTEPVKAKPSVSKPVTKKPVTKKPVQKSIQKAIKPKKAPAKVAPSAAFMVSSHANMNSVKRGSLNFGGKGKPGDRITIFVNGKSMGRAMVKPNGRWSFPVRLWAAGIHKIAAQNQRTRETRIVKLRAR